MNNLRIKPKHLTFPPTLRGQTAVGALKRLQGRSTASVNEQNRKFTPFRESSSLAELNTLRTIRWSEVASFNRTVANLSANLKEISFPKTETGNQIRNTLNESIQAAFNHPLIKKWMSETRVGADWALMTTEEFATFAKQTWGEKDSPSAIEVFSWANAVNGVKPDGSFFIIGNAEKLFLDPSLIFQSWLNEIFETKTHSILAEIIGPEKAKIVISNPIYQYVTWTLDNITWPNMYDQLTQENPNFASMSAEQQLAEIHSYAKTIPDDQFVASFNEELIQARSLTNGSYFKAGSSVVDPKVIPDAPDPRIWIRPLEEKFYDMLGKDVEGMLTGDSIMSSREGLPYISDIEFKVRQSVETTGLTITGGNEKTLAGTNGNDTIKAGDNTEQITAFKGNDSIMGGNGNDLAFAGQGQDSIYGGAGDDTLLGNQHADNLDGGDGNDTLWGGGGNDFLNGGAGINYASGDKGSNGLLLDAEGSTEFEEITTVYVPPEIPFDQILATRTPTRGATINWNGQILAATDSPHPFRLAELKVNGEYRTI